MAYLKTNENTRLFYHDWGNGKPLVFLHAWAMNSDMWENQMLHFLHRGFRCIAYDRRGHGRSDRNGAGYNYDKYSDDLHALLTHLDVHEATLIGHSMGGGEAIRYLSKYGSERISRLILIAATAPYLMKTYDNPEGIDAALFEESRQAIRKDFPKWLADNANAFYLPEMYQVSGEMVQWTIRLILQNSFKAAMDGTYESAETDFRKELQAVRVPALVIHGSADASVPVHFGRQTAALIPDALYKEYVNAPHGLFITHREELNEEILKFLPDGGNAPWERNGHNVDPEEAMHLN